MQVGFRSGAAEAAGRILRAIQADDSRRLEFELERASDLFGTACPDSDTEERVELLESVVDAISERLINGARPRSFEAQAVLLGHLAGLG